MNTQGRKPGDYVFKNIKSMDELENQQVYLLDASSMRMEDITLTNTNKEEKKITFLKENETKSADVLSDNLGFLYIEISRKFYLMK
jgi:hypothetical protein